MNGHHTLETFDASLGRALALYEIRREGRMLAAFGRWSHAGADIDFDDIETVQLVLSVTGGQTIDWSMRDVARREHALAGSVSQVEPKKVTRVQVSGRADTVQIILTQEILETALHHAHNACPPDVTTKQVQALTVAALVELAKARPDEGNAERIVHAASQVVATRMMAGTPRHHRGGISVAAFRRVSSLLDDRFDNRPDALPGVRELADVAGMSLYHFTRSFRVSSGLTPHAWVASRRGDRALNLLLDSDARVDEIAESTGFSSPSHFVSAFRQEMGVTPGKIRAAVHALRQS